MLIPQAYFLQSFGILKFGCVASSALFPFCPNPITFFCQPTADSSHYTTMYCRSILCSVTVLVHTILPIILYTWLDLGRLHTTMTAEKFQEFLLEATESWKIPLGFSKSYLDLPKLHFYNISIPISMHLCSCMYYQ